MYGRLLDVGESVLYHPGEGMHRYGFRSPPRLDGRLSRLHDTCSLQGGNLHDGTAQLSGQFCNIDFVPVLLHHVHHVDGNDHRDAQFGQLRRQIQIPLQVGAVHNVQNGVRALADQIIPRHHFL